MAISKESSAKSKLRNNVKQLLEHNTLTDLQIILSEMKITLPPEKTTEPKRVTMEQVSDFYFTCVDFLAYSPDTQKGYRSEFNLFINFVKKQLKIEPTLLDLTDPIIIKEYLLKYPNKYTNDRKRGFLRSFLRITLWKFYKNTIEDFKRILEIKTEEGIELPRALERHQIMELLEIAANQKAGFRNFTILTIFLSSGIRLNELVNLRIKDIESDGHTFKVLAKGSGGQRLTRYINALGYSLLNDYIDFCYQRQKRKLTDEQYGELYVFSSTSGETNLNRRTIQDFFYEIVMASESIPSGENTPKCTIHTLRHCFAVYGLESGMDIYTISKFLGHKDIKTTAVYLKLVHRQLEIAIEKHPFANGIKEK
ncbi:tyrosine-type recombinase/integrase [Paenibacillus sp. LPE1-1-1.1]|uniref:tyrosine-type recombinase/integrase n=1 Tax=Paenibacillus sp. LPE1-1-1.1 TaxID=3135230 RepID=UPI003417014F